MVDAATENVGAYGITNDLAACCLSQMASCFTTTPFYCMCKTTNGVLPYAPTGLLWKNGKIETTLIL
jgi:hypothetical protein